LRRGNKTLNKGAVFTTGGNTSMTSGQIKVIVAMDFSDDIMAQLRAVSPRYHIERHHPNVPEAAWADAEIIYTTHRFPEPSQAPRLRWIQLHSAGVEQALKQPIVQAEDVDVTNASGIHAVQMSEFCLLMMLTFNYQLLKLLDFQSKSEWPEKSHIIFRPHDLRGQTLGIAGYGAIGRELGRLANNMGMTVLASKNNVKHPADTDSYIIPGTGDPEGNIPARLYPTEALASMAAECDFLVIATPLTDNTRHMVNETVLNAMKKTAFLINVARGSVVDEPALISALAAQKIAGAALDVFEEEPLPKTSPLWNFDNVILTPHVSGNNARYHEKAAALFAENMQRYIEKRPLLNKIERKRGY
jgi:phosphoglycerate dehydrogenase-like enzyme